jgi:hypothetical protein
MAKVKPSTNVKWVLGRTAHLGFVRDSFRPGTVIEHLVNEGAIIIEGRRYDSDRDLIALHKLTEKTGQPWVVPFSEKALVTAKNVPSALAKDKAPVDDNDASKKPLPVIKSDQDEHAEIDISHTKTKPHENKKSNSLEVIRGDETAGDRIARLQSEASKLPVVRDVSLGEVSGPSLNEGGVRVPKVAKITIPKTIVTEPVADTEGLPKDIEVAKMPTFVKTEAVVAPVKRGPGRPRKALQVKGEE